MESVTLTHYHVYAYRKSGGYEARRFDGEPIDTRAKVTHYADRIAHTYDYAEVRDAVGNVVYSIRDPQGMLAKGGEMK
nr:MAG TPA: SHERP PROTEIN [Caudoviricetes sp.]